MGAHRGTRLGDALRNVQWTRTSRRARGTRHRTLGGTCQASRQVAMLKVSILMYRAEGCAVPGRPGHVKTSVSIKTFSA
eukprot:7930855-Pyramimonas_sp.AAC.1